MPRKKRSIPKSGPVWHRTAEEATLARMPKYNAHACGTGAHGDAKYNRARQKQAWRKELHGEGPCIRGGLPFCAQRRRRNPLPHFLILQKRGLPTVYAKSRYLLPSSQVRRRCA